MFIGKKLRRMIAASILTGALIFSPEIICTDLISVAQAEIRAFDGTGECVAGDLIPLDRAKDYARLRAEINAKEKAGGYITRYSHEKNFYLVEDDIYIVTNSIMNIVGDIDYQRETIMWGNSPVVKFIANLTANIDTDGINEYIQRQNSNGGKSISKIESAGRDIIDNLNKIDTLNERYKNSTSQTERNKISADYDQADRNVLAGQKVYAGNEFYYQGKYADAIELYNQSIELNPNYAVAYSNRGNAYAGLKKYEQAVSDYTKAIEFDSNLAAAYCGRGSTYAELKNYKQAISDHNQAIKINPNYFTAYNNRGYTYSKLGNYKKAIADFDKAIKINPNDSQAYCNRGYTYSKLGNYKKAIADFDKAIKINPNDSQTYYNRGSIYSDLKQPERAISDYNKSIELNPNFSEAYFERGVVYQRLEKYEQALSDYTKSLKINPNLETVYFYRGNIYYFYLKNYEQSIRDYSKYIELYVEEWGKHGFLSLAYSYRGAAYKALGKHEEAAADFAKAKD